MSEGFDALSTVKRVLHMHLLRQWIEADVKQLRQTPFQLAGNYIRRLDQIHAHLLASIAEAKRELRRHGVKIIEQQKNNLDFQIAYIEKGYRIHHCFLLATLQADAKLLFDQYISGGIS